MRLSLEQASSIIAVALQAGDEQGLRPLSVAVLDEGGHLTAFSRQDGSSNMRFQIAHGKAYGALALGVGSRGLAARAHEQPHFISAVASAIGGSLIPVPGGVLVKDPDGYTIGSVGVSGDTADADERVAVAAIEATGLLPVTD